MTKTKWSIDPAHSEIEFKTKHLMITTVTGRFTDYAATIEADDDNFMNAKVTFSAKTASVNTNMEMRDNHLKGDDFFSAEKFPEIKFESTSLKHDSGIKYILEGNLTIRDITKTVRLDVEYLGSVVDPYGNVKTGWHVYGKINRKDFGLKWSAVSEAGSLVVADDVKIECNVQFVKQQEIAVAA
jgi:polyisoprenoid-binding protein YceI